MNQARLPVATAFGSYAYGWQQFKKHFLYLFLVGVVVAFANAPLWIAGDTNGAPPPVQPSPLAQMLAAAYSILILSVIKYGAAFMNLRYMRDERPEFTEMFGGFRSNYLNIVLANLLVLAICILGFILLIVPGIVFAIRLSFVPYLVMDKGLEPVAAVEKSWHMTRGHGWAIFRIYLLAIPIFIVGLLMLAVGAFFALIWVATAVASMYHAVDIEDQAQLDANGAPAPA